LSKQPGSQPQLDTSASQAFALELFLQLTTRQSQPLGAFELGALRRLELLQLGALRRLCLLTSSELGAAAFELEAFRVMARALLRFGASPRGVGLLLSAFLFVLTQGRQ